MEWYWWGLLIVGHVVSGSATLIIFAKCAEDKVEAEPLFLAVTCGYLTLAFGIIVGICFLIWLAFNKLSKLALLDFRPDYSHPSFAALHPSTRRGREGHSFTRKGGKLIRRRKSKAKPEIKSGETIKSDLQL